MKSGSPKEYFAGLHLAAMSAIDRFLFERCDPRVCSIMRVAFGLVLCIYALAWMREGALWFSDAGVLRSDTMQHVGPAQAWSILYWLPSTPAVVNICLVIVLVQSLLLLLGCWSRLQAVCLFVWIISFQNRNGMICDGQDVLMRLLLFYMIFMPLDYSWSLGDYLRRTFGGRPAKPIGPSSAWALRLVQFQVAAVYISTVLAKLQGVTWRHGTAVFFVSRMDDLYGRFWLPDFIFETPWIVKSMTWGVLGWEAALPIFLWIPRTRKLALVAAFLLHLSIEYSMHLFLFEWIMMVALLAFFPSRASVRGNIPVSAGQVEVSA